MSLSLVRPQATELKPRIVVFGVGGAGGNAVNNMIDAGLEGVEFVVAKTDRRIQLGETITQGLGAGAHPEVGMNAAEESADEIHAHLEGAHMVFITAGMGGGTGTGAAPIIAKCARDRGILTVGVVTKPFTFEGRHRMRLADAGIAELQRYVDTLIVIPNQNLFRVANERTTFADAFGMADQVLHSGVRSITDLMILPGLINLDFADVRAVMSEMGKAMMGTGEATGDDRALLAAQNAIANPLLDETSLKGAKAVLVNITGGLDMTLLEVDEAANAISAEVDGDANIIFGAAFDPALDGKIRVSVVATGMDEVATAKIEPVATRQPAFHEPRRAEPVAPAASTLRSEPAGREATVAAAYRTPEAAPIVPTFQAPEPVLARAPEPVIHVAEDERKLEPIVDPWVEAFEQDHGRVDTAASTDQADLYFDTPAAPARAEEPAYQEPDHRRSGWSLFGKKPRAQTAFLSFLGTVILLEAGLVIFWW
ncbi:MAG: cell division protein FtsZ [Brevundimonas sp.]